MVGVGLGGPLCLSPLLQLRHVGFRFSRPELRAWSARPPAQAVPRVMFIVKEVARLTLSSFSQFGPIRVT